MLPWIQHRWTGLCLLNIGLGAVILFMYGFFPLKYNSGKMAHMDDLPNFIDGISIDGHEVYNAGENSVILMVIDGLRYDFVTEEYMPYTGQLLKNKSACIYVSVAEPPTVTMPRIKSPERKVEKAQWRRTINFWRDIFAMMTGSVSTFADVALNFGAPAVRGDSVLRTAAARGRRSVLYGDDTWLRLFPGLFAEADGTTSFYVTDYTEVDHNVTRHLDRILAPNEKKRPNFDFLVLHYLGLDHIGHLEGARSPKIKPKLIEMDDVVKKIYTAMQKWGHKGVLFICGDHGMRDAGGHGGATPAEVLVPLVVVKSRDYVCPHPAGPGPTVAQVDLAPTISWLLNAAIPGDSTGRILPSLLPIDVRQHLYLLHLIAAHNARLPSTDTDTEFYKQFKRAEKQFAQYLATGQGSAAKISKEFYEESLEEMAKLLSESTVDFDMFAIGIATLLLYMLATALLCVTFYSLQPEAQRKTYITHKRNYPQIGAIVAFVVIFFIICAILTISCFITETKSQLCSFNPLWSTAFYFVACALTMCYFIIKTGLEKIRDLSAFKDLNVIDYLLVFGTLFHAWSFFGTSFIEEEHLTWYFFWNTLMFFVLIRNIMVVVRYVTKRYQRATEVEEKPQLANKMVDVGIDILPKWIQLIALHRYLRTMNQTGDRWLFLPDTADWLNAPENAFYLQLHLVVGTLATLAICLHNVRHMNNVMWMHTIFTVVATICILCYRIATQTLYSPFDDTKHWDTVAIVDVFWAILSTQFVFELATYIGLFKACGVNPTVKSDKKFVYSKPKAKTEDYFYDEMVEEPWNVDEVKLNLVRSLSHLMLNDMMLIIVLLMRPHNVIMVPSVYVTCVLTSKCMDHKLLDVTAGRRTEIVDVLSRTLVHMWIGCLFFFYQGNSNSLASVDLGSGYVGLREYCPARVALRMGLHAYAGPALAGASLFCVLSTTATSWNQYLLSIWRATNIFAFHRIYCVAVYCIVAAIFRHHLYVWTVFSPKLLYDFVATVFTLQALLTIAEIIALTHITSWLARAVTYKTRL
ncbi:GPI ethanolamine phosphate transferase 2 [Pectinophora gossypiella]|uniref:GPI ethanolamine phosphate transferase 2 n=1 Tax=Pectinophora gossypiella TaxID=13191 RepID=UPI00214E03D2|nr:GPI ethanolamine phosphate transferase 2 [Pectinophora gossypiella]